MEFFGHQKAFLYLLTTGMIIRAFISDRHSAISKWMRVECPKKCKELGKLVVDHFYDLWHIGKSKNIKTDYSTCNLVSTLFRHVSPVSLGLIKM